MKILKVLITSPFFLSLIPFIIIAPLIQRGFDRYLIELEESSVNLLGHYSWFDDIDNDGLSEQLKAIDLENITGLAISRQDEIIDQWNFRGSFNFISKETLFITGDRDDDGIKEIYVFTISNDSVLLHCISDFSTDTLSLKNRLVAVVGRGYKSPDPFIIPAKMEDLDNDGIKELIFGIGTGYSKSPRNVYAYFIKNDSLVVSPESSYFIFRIFQADITGDGIKETMPYGYAACNVSPGEAQYHDNSSFLMVLDQNLKFLFPPVEFGGKYSKVIPFIMREYAGNSLAILSRKSTDNPLPKVYLTDTRAIINDTIQLAVNVIDIYSTNVRGRDNMFIAVIAPEGLALLNDDFKTEKLFPDEAPDHIFQTDLDGDGRDEILTSESSKGRIVIYREGLTDPVSLEIPFEGVNENIISWEKDKTSGALLSVQSGQHHYLVRYRQNPGFPYYYLYYVAIYLGILGFVLTIKNIQKNQLKKNMIMRRKFPNFNWH